MLPIKITGYDGGEIAPKHLCVACLAIRSLPLEEQVIKGERLATPTSQRTGDPKQDVDGGVRRRNLTTHLSGELYLKFVTAE